MEDIKTRIKDHEGYRLEPYKDTLGYLTGGWGHKILSGEEVPISKEGWQSLFDDDFNIAVKGANKLIQEKIPHLLMLGLTEAELSLIEGVLVEMVFQMGRPRVSKFKKMFNAIDEADWNKAADEMLDSRWAKQTFERALNLSSIIRSLL